MSNENTTPSDALSCDLSRVVNKSVMYVYKIRQKQRFCTKKINFSDCANIRRNVSLQIAFIAFLTYSKNHMFFVGQWINWHIATNLTVVTNVCVLQLVSPFQLDTMWLSSKSLSFCRFDTLVCHRSRLIIDGICLESSPHKMNSKAFRSSEGHERLMWEDWLRGYKKNFVLKSAEIKIYPPHRC